jgi:hypothetical protein
MTSTSTSLTKAAGMAASTAGAIFIAVQQLAGVCGLSVFF